MLHLAREERIIERVPFLRRKLRCMVNFHDWEAINGRYVITRRGTRRLAVDQQCQLCGVREVDVFGRNVRSPEDEAVREDRPATPPPLSDTRTPDQ